MSKVEIEYRKISSEEGWGLIYQRIDQECQKYRLSYSEAQKQKNRPLNRYRDVSPYDHSRIALERIENDYINANLVQIPQANRKYILTQGPLLNTAGHFWLMVWEQDCPAIIMLNKVVEKCEVKCHFYWPRGVNDEQKLYLDDVKLMVELIGERKCDSYSIRTLRIYDLLSDAKRDVIQFQHITWPDFGVPTSPTEFLQFLDLVRSSGVLESNRGPPVVHCSAGIGRSGTFCLVDTCLAIAENEGKDNVDIQRTLLQMRNERMGLVQTPDQLRFSYEAVIEGIRFFHTERELLAVPREYMSKGECIDDEVRPDPPPRVESACIAPVKPLPRRPAHLRRRSSAPLKFSISDSDSSESEESQATSPSVEGSESVEECDEEYHYSLPSSGQRSILKQRRNSKPAVVRREEASKENMAHNSPWGKVKRFPFKPVLIAAGVLLAGYYIYTQLRR